MRQLAALLGMAYALLNVYAGFLLASSGVRLGSKAFFDRFLMFSGGTLVFVFAVILAYQMVRLIRASG